MNCVSLKETAARSGRTIARESGEPRSAVDRVTSLLREPALRQTTADFILGSLALALEPNPKKAC